MKKVFFKVVKGSDEGRELPLEYGISLLGRLEGRTSQDPPGSRRLTLFDPTVSRTHCAVTWEAGGEPMLTHLSTTNDTVVNGERISKHTLSSGELVQVGLSQLLFQSLMLEDEFIVSEPVADTTAVVFEAPVSSDEEPETGSVSTPVPEPVPEEHPEPVEEYVHAGSGWGGGGEENSWAPTLGDDSEWAPTVDDDDSGWNPR